MRQMLAPWRHLRAACTIAVPCLALAACGPIDLRPDRRVTVTSPTDRATIELPFTLSWTVRDFDLGSDVDAGDGGWFVVFIDGSLPRPGQSVIDLVRRDATCKADPKCPNERYLVTKGIFATTQTSLEITSLKRPDGPKRRREFHDITIVMVDDEGRRIGENAITRRVVLERT
jgi:hypothetical protein